MECDFHRSVVERRTILIVSHKFKTAQTFPLESQNSETYKSMIIAASIK